MQQVNQLQVNQRWQEQNNHAQFVEAEENNFTKQMYLLITQIDQIIQLDERDGKRKIYLEIKAINSDEQEFEIHYSKISTSKHKLSNLQIIELKFIKQYKLHNNTTLITFATWGSLKEAQNTGDPIYRQLSELKRERQRHQGALEAFNQ